ncbi:hypothetical protein [Nocardioides sp. W7]|uniref:hypothetical protein n=1 Tax=Nocardioides sp. W7 TaxID=2931390 RepID=UPI001FD3BF1A|nr:hypothetical protein [Nocardioides sp. W7]
MAPPPCTSGSYVWDESDTWRLDSDLVGYRSKTRIVLQTCERYGDENGAGLDGRPGRLTVR